jgi:hypothetical protein
VGAVRELVGPAWPELARLLPALGGPDRRGPPGQAAQARLFELLLGLLGRLGDQAPLVLVVEDLQWADRSTRDLLAFLVRNLRRERLLVVVTYRDDEPGHQGLGPYLAELDRADRVGRVELARLDRAQTTAQLVGILGAAPAPELAEAVFARSEGNPFFTEELLGSIRAGSNELPATVWDLLRGRILALPEPASQVLAVVAVAGRRVPHRLLAAVAGRDDDTLVARLRTAVADQLLVTQPAEDGYEFRHACSARSSRPTCCPANGPGSTASTPRHWPTAPSWPVAHRRWPRPSLPSIGTAPASPPGPYQPGSPLAERPSRPAPSPRQTGITNEPWSCGARSPIRSGPLGWTGSSCSPGRPRQPSERAPPTAPPGCSNRPSAT